MAKPSHDDLMAKGMAKPMATKIAGPRPVPMKPGGMPSMPLAKPACK